MDELLERILAWFGRLMLAILAGLVWAGLKGEDRPCTARNAEPPAAQTPAPASRTVIMITPAEPRRSPECQPRVWVRSCR